MSTDLLTATGLAVLLVYGAEIKVARAGQPGVRITADAAGDVLLEAVGWPDGPSAQTAISEAHSACVVAGLEVTVLPPVPTPRRLVRRKP